MLTTMDVILVTILGGVLSIIFPAIFVASIAVAAFVLMISLRAICSGYIFESFRYSIALYHWFQ